MKKVILLLAAWLVTLAGAWADVYPIDSYEEPRLGDTAPAAEWNAIAAGLHATWGCRDVLYSLHRVPQLTETNEAEIWAWKGERANLEAVLFSNTDQGNLSVRFVDDSDTVLTWCSARFLNYVITDDFKACGTHNMSLVKWLAPDVIEQDKAHAVPACETRPVWCTIEVPRNAETGIHKVHLQVVDAAGLVVQTLHLSIHVDTHTLPAVADQKFHLDLWQQPYAVSRYYGVERWSEEHIAALRPYLEALGKAGQKVVSTIMFYEPWGDQSHDKFSPMVQTTKKADGTWSYDYTIFDKYVELCAEYGITEQINCYSMVPWDMTFRYYDEASGKDVDLKTTTSASDYKTLWNSFLDAFKAHLQEKGWFGKTCIAMDERGEAAMLDAWNVASAKGFKMALAGNYHASLSTRLNDYCVALDQVQRFSQEQLLLRKQNGMTTTLYVSCADAEPNIYTNSLPAEAAFLPLHAAANNLDGFLHWSWINWHETPLTDSRYRLFGSGDTYCYYPGNRSSVRFERLVEGIHQFEKIQILKEEYKDNSEKLNQLNLLLADCQDYVLVGEECADKVNRLEDFLNGKEILMPENTYSGYYKIKVDDTHYAKSAAKNTQWSTELSVQTSYDLFLITGSSYGCTIKLKGRSNNIGPDKNNQLFVDQTARSKYAVHSGEDGKVYLKNGAYWVFVDNGTFTWCETDSTALELIAVDEQETLGEGAPQMSDEAVTNWYTLHSARLSNYYPTSKGSGNAVQSQTDGSKQAAEWKFVRRTDGTLDIVNRADGLYLSPVASYDSALKATAEPPTSGWKLLPSGQVGYFLLVCEATHTEMNQTKASQSYQLYNWGYGEESAGAYSYTDDGCWFAFSLTESVKNTSGISAPTAEASSELWFDVNGHRISKPAKTGVYISNLGKKMIPTK